MWALQLPCPEECIVLYLSLYHSRLPHRTECWIVRVYLSAITIEVWAKSRLNQGSLDNLTMFLSVFNIHTI
jgi:hypothetical protein